MQQEQSNYNKNRLVALGALILLVLIILFLIWWWFLPKKTPAPVAGLPIVPPEDRVVLPTQVQTPVAPLLPSAATPSAGEAEAMNLARNFAERYGSWSTDSNYQNLTDLFPSVTERLKQEFRQTIAQAPEHRDFTGVDTRALNVEMTSFTNTRARAVVTTQRTERNAQLEPVVRYENLELSMLKQGQFWLVDTAVWQ